jgi:hypothetical protein
VGARRNLHPVLMKSLSDAARCVLLARQPKATQSAVRMALFPPAPSRVREIIHQKRVRKKKGETLGFGEETKRTSVLASYEIDMTTELDL